ncbi:Protein of unknown function [Sulfitobacter brevis]|uniref:Uncharacterized protein n=1 Tax=Sulfitobacter brevis TaxID=74348 RepID=A0A1I2DL76_9RHOB|nr:DUF2793 domain-containing protein [Sulfitobacter brevis]SFE81324.1 Protein of unknown function [Sulfitobacter brevis]
MSQISQILSLPYIQPAQAQKHVTHNEALRQLDAIVQLAVADVPLSTPPASPALGVRFIVGPAPTGAWAGKENNVALHTDGQWVFFTPIAGWRADVLATGTTLRFDGVTWISPAQGPLQNIDEIGVNTTADPTNRLSVAADATLLTHTGAGHQLKVNKADAGDTASLLFQTGFSGRAEMGTAGSDDFSVKVSADGASFKTALATDAATGITSVPSGFDSAQFLVDYDDFLVIHPPTAGGMMILSIVDQTYPQGSASGIFVYDVGASAQLLTVWVGGAMTNMGVATLTGATGPSGKVSVSARANDGLYVENRYQSSGTRQFSISYINGFRNIS